MSPAHNGGFTTFVLSTDDNAVYEPDKRLLSLVCNRQDAARITDLIHRDCMRRVGRGRAGGRAASGSSDASTSCRRVARYVPVTLGHEYLGVPVAEQPGSFELTDEMLTYYGEPIDGQPETALGREDGVIPDEHADVRVDQGRVPALLQQRAEGSARCRSRASAPAACCSPTCCARSASSASASWTASRSPTRC